MEEKDDSNLRLQNFIDKARSLNALCKESRKIENSEDSRDELQVKLVELGDLYKTLTAFSNEFLELSNKNDNIIIKTEHIKLSKINDGLQLIIESLSNKLKEENYKFIKETSDLKLQYQQLVSEYQTKSELYDKLNKKYESSCQDEEILSQEIHDLKERIKYLEKQNERLECRYQIMEEKMYAMRRKVEDEQKEKDIMSEVLGKCSDKLKLALQCDRERIEKLERAEKEIAKLKKSEKKQKEDYDLQIEKLKQKISNLQDNPNEEKTSFSRLKFW